MHKALIVAQELSCCDSLKKKLSEYFPKLEVVGCCDCFSTAQKFLDVNEIKLIFLDTDSSLLKDIKLLQYILEFPTQLIFISAVIDNLITAVNFQVCGYLLKPIQDEDLVLAVRNAKKKILSEEEKAKSQNLLNRSILQLPPNDLIGIPTIEGLEFLSVGDIIRCEGLQKCTRILTLNRKDIISSYNIGEFKKMLSNFGFFSTHKSHLINLRYIKKYYKEGTVIMKDDSPVPVSKRKKKEFLELLPHL